MQVVFTSRDPQAAGLRLLAEQRLRFALRRLKTRVPRAEVELSDVNGPRGGVDKRCQLALRTDGVGPVVVSSVAADWRSALDRALARATRFLLREARRAQDMRRQRRRARAAEASAD
ncbi:HPF/RaiA family ribosome-associated protein [Aquincola tertiaricarbonis]|uniref:HPF/RaiA family ribosome-associated protein n=1 Tax=Aquincola tertiaricarbonis TaxID=391953 RepID=A0ABY4S8J0_AQUTE|nr:HPF/RaiA family ribosome-associated protein [Aquincola tertiaricarbonis]URI08520.1 HPF/RaiA family ribosome-associated protein [Aquincola tertiaricarbonis]